jgi:hypothetical protein
MPQKFTGVLPGHPTRPLEAASKAYVDSVLGGGAPRTDLPGVGTTTVITVTPADVGTIVASNGVLMSIGVPTMPDGRGANGAFTLVEAGGPGVAPQLFSIDSNGMGIVMGEIICRQRTGLGIGPVMSRYPIVFNALMVAAVPRGAVIELAVQ